MAAIGRSDWEGKRTGVPAAGAAGTLREEARGRDTAGEAVTSLGVAGFLHLALDLLLGIVEGCINRLLACKR